MADMTEEELVREITDIKELADEAEEMAREADTSVKALKSIAGSLVALDRLLLLIVASGG